MSILPVAAALAALVLFSSRKRSRPSSSTSPPTTQPPEGEGEPPSGPRKPGSAYVAPVGVKGSTGKPPPKGGGLVFPGPGGGDDGTDSPIQHGIAQQPSQPGQAVGQYAPPAPLHFETKVATADDAHEVELVSQLEGDPLPSGRYRMKLVFAAGLTAPKLVPHPSTFGWDYSKTVAYGQRETITYEITIDGAAAAIVRKSASSKNMVTKLQPFMFGCQTKEECGWNGSYTSYFHPRLTWENGLLLRFDTRKLAVDPTQAGILFTTIVADVTFEVLP
jgi:hypothetical protein